MPAEFCFANIMVFFYQQNKKKLHKGSAISHSYRLLNLTGHWVRTLDLKNNSLCASIREPPFDIQI